MSTEADFQTISKKLADGGKNGSIKMSNDEALIFYGLYKQATVGDNNESQPGMLSFEKKAKWGAWNKVKGTSKEDAMRKYVELAKKYTS